MRLLSFGIGLRENVGMPYPGSPFWHPEWPTTIHPNAFAAKFFSFWRLRPRKSPVPRVSAGCARSRAGFETPGLKHHETPRQVHGRLRGTQRLRKLLCVNGELGGYPRPKLLRRYSYPTCTFVILTGGDFVLRFELGLARRPRMMCLLSAFGTGRRGVNGGLPRKCLSGGPRCRAGLSQFVRCRVVRKAASYWC